MRMRIFDYFFNWSSQAILIGSPIMQYNRGQIVDFIQLDKFGIYSELVAMVFIHEVKW